MSDDIETIKASFTIYQAWNDLGLEGEPGKCVRSPFRSDNRPSFSVFENSTRFKDHAVSEHRGDVLDFIQLAKGCEVAEAIQWAKDRLGMETQTKAKPTGTQRKLPDLEPLAAAELQKLAELRGLSLEGLGLAVSRGLLWGATMWRGLRAWAVTDAARRIVEFRRLDGRWWDAFGHLHQRKAHCVGRGKAWPVGLEHVAAAKTIMFVEGAPDLLAAHHFIALEQKAKTHCAVSMLGAGANHIAEEALAPFEGKDVVIYPHCDEAGRRACKSWARQLHAVGSRVLAFDLSGLLMVGGEKGKDLCDLAAIDPDCWESDPKWREVLS